MSDAPMAAGLPQLGTAAGCAARPSAAPCEPLEGNYFVSTYPPFSVWNAAELPAVEAALAAASDPARARPPLGLYVHIPFCVKRCQYCYYLAYDDKSAEIVDAYLDALAREIDLLRDAAALRGRPLDFAYIGGGTPSLLSRRRLETLFERLHAAFDFRHVRESTFECAPQSVTIDKLRALRAAGVNRVSMGVQQLDDDVLLASGRVHTVRDVLRAWDAIRSVGFPIVNLDLIAGLPGESETSFLDGLERVIALKPESVTIYPLELPQNTPLFREWRAGELDAPLTDWETKRGRVGRAFARLEGAGYTVRSAYAAVRDPARQPFLYQDEQYCGADLLGLGVAAFSYLAGVHFQNLATLEPYLDAVAAGRRPLGRAHALSADERLVREFVLQLKLGRTEHAYFREKFDTDPVTRFAEPLAQLTALGMLRVEDAGVRLTRTGLLRADRLLPEFYRPEHRGVRYT